MRSITSHGTILVPNDGALRRLVAFRFQWNRHFKPFIQHFTPFIEQLIDLILSN